MNSIYVGKIFQTYSEIEVAVSIYQKAHGIQFYRRDARTIEAAKKRACEKTFSPAIKFYDLRYCCIHGGREFKKRGGGIRETSTFKQGCTAYIHASASKMGDSLVVKSMSEVHNHTIQPELFQYLPQQRCKLSDELKAEATDLLKLKANKKLVQHHIGQKAGSLVTLKDLSNLVASKSGELRNDLVTFVGQLETKYNAQVDVLVGEDNVLRGLLFQDNAMKNYLRSFPEIIFIDATYKLLEIRTPVYLTICEDSMGNSEVVSVGMLVAEDEDSLLWMFQTLHNRNPGMDRVRVIITDKDLTERSVLRRVFPNASLLLCLFHTLRAFRREVTCEKMGITSEQRAVCLQSLQRLAYAKSEVAYERLYQDFVEVAADAVVKYYNQNWNTIKEDWVMAYTFSNGNFLNSTNNRIECINSKLKSVIDKFSSLEDFLEKLYVILGTMRFERDSKAATRFLKLSASPAPTELCETKYVRLLTHYASDMVQKQLKRSLLVKFSAVDVDVFFVDLGEFVVEVTASTCKCLFRKSMLLPCAHIFAVRRKLAIDLFEERLCDRRWHADYFRLHGRIFSDVASLTSRPASAVTHTSSAQPRILSGQEKVKIGLRYGASLANLHADVGTVEFNERVEVYKKLERLWQSGKRVIVSELEGGNTSPFHANEASTNDRHESEFDAFELSSSVMNERDGNSCLQNKDSLAVSHLHASEMEVTSPAENNPDSSSCLQTDESLITIEVEDSESEYFGVTLTMAADGSSCLQSEDSSKFMGQEDQSQSHFAIATSTEYSSVDVPTGSKRSIAIQDISLPPRIKRRGRPKGQDTTVIGLPKYRGNGRVLPFAKHPPSIREKIMVSWFISSSHIVSSVKECKIQKHQLECREQFIPIACLDDAVDIVSIKKYFSDDAWTALQCVLKAKAKCNLFLCGACKTKLRNPSICCDSCLLWFDFSCVGLKFSPKTEHWFCMECLKHYSSL